MLNQENRYLFKFAWKSIRRNSGRSFFIGFSVSLAVMIAVWIVAFFEGLNTQIEEAVVQTNTGYFQLQEPHFAKSTDSSFPMEFTPKLYEKLKQTPVQSFSPELVLDGNIATPEGAAGLAVIGIEPSYHEKFLPIAQSIDSGRFVQAQDESAIVIGKELATIFKFKVGEQLVLNYQDVNGELRSELLTIEGIYHYNSMTFEKRFVYVSQATWQKLFLNQNSGKILFNRIPIMTHNLEDQAALQMNLGETNTEFKTWKNLNPEMAVVLDFHDGMIRFFFVIIGITILMTILTPVRMLWQERLKELRMMNIVGVAQNKFWKIGLFEVFQMIVLSGIFSSILLAIVIGIQSRTGIDFRYLSGGVAIERAGIKLPAIIFPILSSDEVLITFGFVIFVLSFSYIWSIYRTMKRLEVEL